MTLRALICPYSCCTVHSPGTRCYIKAHESSPPVGQDRVKNQARGPTLLKTGLSRTGPKAVGILEIPKSNQLYQKREDNKVEQVIIIIDLTQKTPLQPGGLIHSIWTSISPHSTFLSLRNMSCRICHCPKHSSSHQIGSSSCSAEPS